MSRHLIIDGYNVIRKTPQLGAATLEEERAALVRLIEVNRPQGSSRNQVTVVFDGSEAVCGWPSTGETRVLFSKGETADDLIKKIVDEALQPRAMIVVTDDRDLAHAVRTLGAEVWSVEVFIGQARKHAPAAKPRKPGQAISDGKVVPYTLESRVNRELSELWLNKKSKVV